MITTEVNLEDYGVVEQELQEDQSLMTILRTLISIAAKQNKYNVYNDGIAFEFPVKWQELPAPRESRGILWGDEKFAMDITKWTADGTLIWLMKAPAGTKISANGTILPRE